MKKYIKLYEEFINENVYNLGISSDRYVSALKKALEVVKGIAEYGVIDSAHNIYIHTEPGLHGTDLTDQIKTALTGIDSNLDLDKITNDLNASDDERSHENKEKGVTNYKIPKKLSYHDVHKRNEPKTDTDMSSDITLDLLDMLAQYSSEGNPLADQEWRTLDNFLSSAKDLMSATDYIKYVKSIKAKYPNLK